MHEAPKKYSTQLVPAAIAGGAGALMGGAGALMGAVSTYTMAKEVNASITQNPTQNFTIDDAAKSISANIKDAVFATIIGVTAGGKIGAGLGAAAGYTAGESKLAKVGFAGIGGIMGATAGGVMATVGSYMFFQKNRINKANGIERQVLSSLGRIKKTAVRIGESGFKVNKMMSDLQTNLIFIATVPSPESPEHLAEREKAFEALKASIPFMPYNSIASDIPTDPLTFLRAVSLERLRTITKDKLNPEEVPSVDEIVKGAFAYSKTDLDPNSMRSIALYKTGAKKSWAENHVVAAAVLTDPLVKNQLFVHIDNNLSTTRRNQIYAALRSAVGPSASVATADMARILHLLEPKEYLQFLKIVQDDPEQNNSIVKRTLLSTIPGLNHQADMSAANASWSDRANANHQSTDEQAAPNTDQNRTFFSNLTEKIKENPIVMGLSGKELFEQSAPVRAWFKRTFMSNQANRQNIPAR